MFGLIIYHLLSRVINGKIVGGKNRIASIIVQSFTKFLGKGLFVKMNCYKLQAVYNGLQAIIIIAVLVFIFFPATVLAVQLFPPEIPVLFYGNVKIDDNPAAVNTVIVTKIEKSDIEIANGAVKNIGKYFIEVPCQNYIGENIIFKLGNLAGGQNKCPDVQTTPSIKLDLTAEITDIPAYKQDAETNIPKSVGNPIILAPTPCVKVIYDKWQNTCVNNWQYRNIISIIPNNCLMTAEQKAQTERKCGLTDTGGEIKVLSIEYYADGSLIRGSDMKVYLIEKQVKRHIANIKALEKFTGQEILNVSDEITDFYPTGLKICAEYQNGDLIRGKDMRIYVIKNNKKYYINLEELQKYAGRKIYNASNQVLNQY
ncbi:hypothetical protein KKC04_01825 [Patescibacteria group bacterium]|nr:hypothetical protein [Patescibacteria group bacterium]